jgi:DNA-binding beta-propeller fold protein YncE
MRILLASAAAALMVCIGWSVAHSQGIGVQVTMEPADEGPLKVLKTFTLGGEGGWDYITADPDSARVYVGRSTRIMVIDSGSGKLIGEVPDCKGAHGVALVPKFNQGFASCGTDSDLAIFDLKTLETVGRMTAGKNPDAILYDPASEKVFAFNHSDGTVTVVRMAYAYKADRAKVMYNVETIEVGGKLEFGATDGAGHVYVNVEDKNEVVEIDSKTLKVLAHWTIAPGEGPTGLAIDPAHHRLFVGCSNKEMVILDSESGKVLGSADIGAGVDGVAFDATLGLAMSANGRDGTITAVKETADGKFTVVQTLPTMKSARTIADDPKTHRAYLPCNIPDKDGKLSFGIVVVGSAQEK